MLALNGARPCPSVQGLLLHSDLSRHPRFTNLLRQTGQEERRGVRWRESLKPGRRREIRVLRRVWVALGGLQLAEEVRFFK